MTATPSKITLTRQPQALLSLDTALLPQLFETRRLDSKNDIKSTVPIINYKSTTYQAEVLVNNHKVVVLVDTGSSDFWLSCAFASDFGCSSTCPYDSTLLMYGSGNVCILPATGTLQVGDLVLKDYVISVGQGRNMVPNTKDSILPPTTQGLFGLAYASLAKVPNRKAGQFIDHLESFSIYLTDAANSTGSFLMLNGVDTALIAKEKLTPFTIPVVAKPKHWTIGMTAFQVGNDAVQFPCSSSSLLFKDDPTRCNSLVDTGTSLLSMPESIFRTFARKTLVPLGCRDARTFVTGAKKELYVCESSVTLPRLSFTFDDYTFYIRQSDYVVPIPDSKYVIVEVQSSGFGSEDWILGDTFLKLFYASYQVNQSVTFYCRDGDCAKSVVVNPVEPQPRTAAPTATSAPGTASGKSSSPSTKSSSSSTAGIAGSDAATTSASSGSSSDTATILAVVLGLVGVALLVGAFLFVRARKRRAAAGQPSESLPSPTPVMAATTPVSTSAAYYAAPAQTPAEARI